MLAPASDVFLARHLSALISVKCLIVSIFHEFPEIRMEIAK
jgi:hypothetical protein